MAKKITYGVLAALVIATVALVFFYRAIHREQWELRDAAIKTVTDHTYMESIDRVESFVGEKPYMIVFGKVPVGKNAIFWVDGSSVHMEYETSGITEAEARQKVTELHPDNEVLRVMPGVLSNTYVWEVMYSRKEEDGTRYYYGYYRFDNGSEIDTWRLSKRR